MGQTVTYKTNSNNRKFKLWTDVPPAVLKDQFSHLNEEDNFDGFFNYRNYWYHLTDFMRVMACDGAFPDAPFRVDGYLSDSYFSGIIINIPDSDMEEYKVATFFS